MLLKISMKMMLLALACWRPAELVGRGGEEEEKKKKKDLRKKGSVEERKLRACIESCILWWKSEERAGG
jgi:hypothetical protein